MVGRHHRHEFEQAPGDDERQGSLACCGPWGHKESDMTEPQQTTLQFLIHRTPEAPLSPGPPGPALPPTPSAAHYFHTGWDRDKVSASGRQ